MSAQEDKGLGPGATLLDHPLGAWRVKEVRLLVCYDPEGSDPATEQQITDAVRGDIASRHDIGMVYVKDEDAVGYVLGSWHGPHLDGDGCDCGPDMPDDWYERINPLLPAGLIVLLDRVRSHVEVHRVESDVESLRVGLRDAERALDSVSENYNKVRETPGPPSE